MHTSSLRWTALTAVSLLFGQSLLGISSVRADDARPVASDLVDLALAIPEAAAEVEEANARLPFLTQLHKKGNVPQSELDDLLPRRKTAGHKLELLRLIIEAELKSVETRYATVKEHRKLAVGGSPFDVTAAEERWKLLHLLKEACSVPKAADEDATSLKIESPAAISGIARVNGDVPELPPRVEPKRTINSRRQ